MYKNMWLFLSLLFIFETTLFCSPKKTAPKSVKKDDSSGDDEFDRVLEQYAKSAPKQPKAEPKSVQPESIQSSNNPSSVSAPFSLAKKQIIEPNLTQLKLIINSNPACVQEVDATGFSLFMIAVHYGNKKIIDYLLSLSKVDINLQNEEGSSALIIAVNAFNIGIARLLVKNGANKDLQNEQGFTALMIAAQKNYIDIAKLLVENGADKDLETQQQGFTALMIAAQKNHIDIVKALVTAGAKINLQNKEGFTALMFAVKYNHPEIVNYLLTQKAEINTRSIHGVTALMQAVCFGYQEIVAALIRHQADVNLQSDEGFTALMFAIFIGKEEVVRVLLDNNADSNAQNNQGFTALMYAVEQSCLGIVNLLLQEKVNKVNVDLINKDGFTALMIAARNGYVDGLEILLDAGANISLQNTEGFTALRLSLLNLHENVALKLLAEEENQEESLEDSVVFFKTISGQIQNMSEETKEFVKEQIPFVLSMIQKLKLGEEVEQIEEQLSQKVESVESQPSKTPSPKKNESKRESDSDKAVRQQALKEASQERKLLRKKRREENERNTVAKKAQKAEEITKLAKLLLQGAVELLKGSNGYDEYQLEKYKDLFVVQDPAAIKSLTDMTHYWSEFHGLKRVSLNLDHILSANVGWELNNVNRYMPVIKGAHTQQAINMLASQGVVKIIETKNKDAGVVEYKLKNLWSDEVFVKTTFPQNWNAQEIISNLEKGQKQTEPTASFGSQTLELLCDAVMVKVVLQETHSSFFRDKQYKIITAYPVSTKTSALPIHSSVPKTGPQLDPSAPPVATAAPF